MVPEQTADERVQHRIPPTENQREKSVGELISELAEDMSTLVRKEIELARTETMEKVSTATGSIITMVLGGLLAYAGLIALIIAAAIALGQIMPYWLSTLVVGLVIILIGAIFLMSGRSSLKNMSVKPEKTIDTLKEDAKWAKEQVQ